MTETTETTLTTLTLISPRGERVEFTVDATGPTSTLKLEREARLAVRPYLPCPAMKVRLTQGFATVSLGYLQSESWLCRIDRHKDRGGPLDANVYLDRTWGAGFHKRFEKKES